MKKTKKPVYSPKPGAAVKPVKTVKASELAKAPEITKEASRTAPKSSFLQQLRQPFAQMVIVLFAITAVCAFILAFVNENTFDIIAARTQEKLNISMKSVMPAADSFEETDFLAEEPVSKLYLARTQDKLAGYCVVSKPGGFGGAITLMVGVDLQGAVTKVLIVGMSETPGLGTKANNEDFISQYEGKTSGITVNGKDNGISAITGATVTSKAVTSGVNAALAAVTAYQAEKGGN